MLHKKKKSVDKGIDFQKIIYSEGSIFLVTKKKMFVRAKFGIFFLLKGLDFYEISVNKGHILVLNLP